MERLSYIQEIASKVEGKVSSSELKDTCLLEGSQVTIKGPRRLQPREVAKYTIVNFDPTKPYILTLVRGTGINGSVISRVGNTITYAAPRESGVVAGFYVNARLVTVTNNVINNRVNYAETPRILSPVSGVNNLTYSIVASATIFEYVGITQRHTESEWEISLRDDFVGARLYSVPGHGNSVKLVNLDSDAYYHLRVKQHGNLSGWTNWSDPVRFETMTFNGTVVSLDSLASDFYYDVTVNPVNGVVCAVGSQTSTSDNDTQAFFCVWSNINGILTNMEQRSIGGSSMEVLYSVADISESTFIAVGAQNSSTAGNLDFLITSWVYNDNTLLLADSKSYGGELPDILHGVCSIKNNMHNPFNHFLTVGQSGKAGYISVWNSDPITGDLSIQSEAFIGNHDKNSLSAVEHLGGDLFVSVGQQGEEQTNNISAFITLWRLSVDKKLVLLDQKSLGNSEVYLFEDLAIDSKKRIYAVGSYNNTSSRNYNGLITRWIVQNNTLFLDETFGFGGNSNEVFKKVTIDKFDNILVSGKSDQRKTGVMDAMLIVISDNVAGLRVLSGRLLGGARNDVFESVTVDDKGMIICAGNQTSQSSGIESCLLATWKFNSTGFNGTLGNITNGDLVSMNITNAVLPAFNLNMDSISTALAVNTPAITPTLKQESLLAVEENLGIRKSYY